MEIVKYFNYNSIVILTMFHCYSLFDFFLKIWFLIVGMIIIARMSFKALKNKNVC